MLLAGAGGVGEAVLYVLSFSYNLDALIYSLRRLTAITYKQRRRREAKLGKGTRTWGERPRG